MEQNEATTATGSTVVAPPPLPPPPPTSQYPQPLSPPQTHPPLQPLLPTQPLLPPKPLPPSPPPSEQNIEVVQSVQLPAQQPPQFTSSQDASSFPVKKRGRPRKYAPDGSLAVPSKPKKPQPLNPMPISASMPVGDFVMTAPMVNHRGRARFGGGGSGGGVRNIEFESPGETVACSSGANFTPHIITVGAGEDVTMKVISFSQQGPRAICILSASGTISNVTIRQPDSSGGTLTYEGRFELLSLSGSFMPSDSGGTRSRSGGMSVSLSSPDGRVVGGSVAGLLVAATPVQVIVGSFLPSYEIEQKQKKPRYENTPISIPSHGIPMSFTQTDENYSNSSGQGQHQNANMKPSNLSTSSSYRGDNNNNNWSATIHSVSETRSNNGANTDINIPFSAC